MAAGQGRAGQGRAGQASVLFPRRLTSCMGERSRAEHVPALCPDDSGCAAFGAHRGAATLNNIPHTVTRARPLAGCWPWHLLQWIPIPLAAFARRPAGRGRQVIAVCKSADLLLMVLDAGKPHYHREILTRELEAVRAGAGGAGGCCHGWIAAEALLCKGRRRSRQLF